MVVLRPRSVFAAALLFVGGEATAGGSRTCETGGPGIVAATGVMSGRVDGGADNGQLTFFGGTSFSDPQAELGIVFRDQVNGFLLRVDDSKGNPVGTWKAAANFHSQSFCPDNIITHVDGTLKSEVFSFTPLVMEDVTVSAIFYNTAQLTFTRASQVLTYNGPTPFSSPFDGTEPEATVPERTEPEATEPEATEPEATEPEATEPQGTEPEATEPEGTEPEATEPEGTEPEATEPEGTEPEGTEPEGTEPEATEPEGTEPEGTEPEGTEPEGTEPEVTEPEGTEPEATEPEGTEPEGTEPEGTEPEATEPEGTEPEGTEPEGTEPEGTEPEGTEPEGTEPEGTEPEGTEPEGTEPESTGTEPEGTEPESTGTEPEGTQPNPPQPGDMYMPCKPDGTCNAGDLGALECKTRNGTTVCEYPGFCTNMHDVLILRSDAFSQAQDDCISQSLADSDLTLSKLPACLEATGVSTECVGCIASAVQCASPLRTPACGMCLETPTPTSCVRCAYDNCNDAYSTCSGSVLPNPQDFNCSLANDVSVSTTTRSECANVPAGDSCAVTCAIGYSLATSALGGTTCATDPRTYEGAFDVSTPCVAVIASGAVSHFVATVAVVVTSSVVASFFVLL